MSFFNEEQMKELAFDIALSLSEELFANIKPDQLANIASPEYLAWMATEIFTHSAVLDADKMHRWIGYIQGVAIVTGLTSLDRERERVRKLREKIVGEH